VIVNKIVRNRTIRKRICVRFEHVKKSRCTEQFAAKQKAFAEFQALKKSGKPLPAKKVSARVGGFVKKANVEVLARRAADYEAMIPY
jgi:large subunit ribosomal protein L21e